jgi:hypothetical protein
MSDVKFMEDPKGYVSIWKEPIQGEHYCIGADVAEGLIDGDFSCGYVGDSQFDLVARWHGHIDPDLLEWNWLSWLCITMMLISVWRVIIMVLLLLTLSRN